MSAGLVSKFVQYVIVGKSDRRRYGLENDQSVNEKVVKAINNGISPIICIGETKEERVYGIGELAIKMRLHYALKSVKTNKFVIAYDPVDTTTPAPLVTHTVVNIIREELKKLFPEDIARNVRILYGGFMTPDDMEYIQEEGVDGFLYSGVRTPEDIKFLLKMYKNN